MAVGWRGTCCWGVGTLWSGRRLDSRRPILDTHDLSRIRRGALLTSIATLVIAAQPGVGFAAPRWEAAWGSTTLLGHVLSEVRSWPVDERVVVLGAAAEHVLDVVDIEGFDAIIDPEWEEGESASLRSGVDYLVRSSDADRLLVADGAAPGVTADVIEELIDAHDAQDRPATIGKYRYSRTWPVIVAREMWPRLLGLEGAGGLASLIETHPSWVNEHRFDRLPPRTIATPDDLAARSPRH